MKSRNPSRAQTQALVSGRLATPLAVHFELYPWSDQASESLGIRPQGAIALHIKFTRKEQTSLPALGFKGKVSEY